MKAYVICLNDFPEHVHLGTHGEAEDKKDELREKHPVKKYWHVKEVPVTPINPIKDIQRSLDGIQTCVSLAPIHHLYLEAEFDKGST